MDISLTVDDAAAPPPPPVNRRMSAMGNQNIAAMKSEGSMKAMETAQVEIGRRQSARLTNMPGANTADQLAAEMGALNDFFAEFEAKQAAESIEKIRQHFKDGTFDAKGYCSDWAVANAKKIQEVTLVDALNVYAPVCNEEIVLNFEHLYEKEKEPWNMAGFMTIMHPSVVMNGCEHATNVCLENTLYGLCIGSCMFGCYMGCKTACCASQSVSGMLERKKIAETEIDKRMVHHWDNVFKAGVSEGKINLNMPPEEFRKKHTDPINAQPANELGQKMQTAWSIVNPADWEKL